MPLSMADFKRKAFLEIDQYSNLILPEIVTQSFFFSFFSSPLNFLPKMETETPSISLFLICLKISTGEERGNNGTKRERKIKIFFSPPLRERVLRNRPRVFPVCYLSDGIFISFPNCGRINKPHSNAATKRKKITQLSLTIACARRPLFLLLFFTET